MKFLWSASSSFLLVGFVSSGSYSYPSRSRARRFDQCDQWKRNFGAAQSKASNLAGREPEVGQAHFTGMWAHRAGLALLAQPRASASRREHRCLPHRSLATPTRGLPARNRRSCFSKGQWESEEFQSDVWQCRESQNTKRDFPRGKPPRRHALKARVGGMASQRRAKASLGRGIGSRGRSKASPGRGIGS